MNKKLPSKNLGGFRSPLMIARVLVFFLVLTAVSHAAFAQLELLKDINLYEEHSYNEYSLLTHGQGRMYFVVNGKELWKSNGTAESSIRLRSFESISNLTMAGTTLYFTADDGGTGTELWKSNGTVGNTVRVKDIMPGSASSSPHNLTNVGGVLYFAAYLQVGGIELWKSDGTANGTVMVKDIAQGNANSSPRNMVNANGVLYFGATTAGNGYELWRSDGTAAGTAIVKDIIPGKQGSDPQLLTYFSNKIYFTAYDASTGREMWSSDGTLAGTVRVKDIRAGSQSATPRNLTVVGSQLMFTAHDGTHGDELWKTDGTTAGTVLVKDMNPGGVGSNSTNVLKTPMRDFTNANGILYFVAAKGATEYIYRSDGTASGTFIIQEAISFSYEVFQPVFTYMNGSVYFFNGERYSEDQNLLRMPYKGAASQVSTVRIIGKPFGWSESIPVHNEMIHFYNNLYFFGRYSFNDYENYNSGSYELMRSDGTYEGTTTVVDAYVTTEGEQPRTMIRAGKYVYMYPYGPLSYSPPLYVTDGTPEGTIELISETTPITWTAVGDQLYVVYGPYDGSESWTLMRFNGPHGVTLASGEDLYGPTVPTNLRAVGDLLYFSNEQGEVYKTDGTREGTVRVYDVSTASAVHKVGSQTLVFQVSGTSTQIWRQTASGETLVKDVGPGRTTRSVVSGNVLYFALGSDAYSNDYQLWRTDGTSAGTFVVGGTTGGAWDRSRTMHLMVINDQLYFSGNNSAGGTSLFHAFGTTIEKVADMPPITESAVVNNHLLMYAGVGDQVEVYGTDGTTAGTHLFTTLDSPLYSEWINTAVIGDYAYFNAYLNDTDYVWRTDGTLCGTYPVYLGTSGNFGLVALGNDLVFGGATIKTGNEPHIYHNINNVSGTPACVEETSFASMGAAEAKEEQTSELAYPNPFTDSFVFKMEDDASSSGIEVAVFTVYGLPVETVRNIKSNTDYNLGTNWPQGSYIIKIKTADKTITHQVIKK